MFWPDFRAAHPGARIEINRHARVSIVLGGVVVGSGWSAVEAIAGARHRLAVRTVLASVPGDTSVVVALPRGGA